MRYGWSRPNPLFLPALAGPDPIFIYRPAHYLKQFHENYAEKKKLESGKSTSFQVLQLTKDLTTARVNEIVALTQYNIDQAAIALAEGSTLDRRHITLEWK